MNITHPREGWQLAEGEKAEKEERVMAHGALGREHATHGDSEGARA